MTFPRVKERQLGILRALYERKGEAAKNDHSLYAQIASYFPQITAADLARTTPKSGYNTWSNACYWEFTTLKERGEVEYPSRGALGITVKGKKRLGDEWLPHWGPKPPGLELILPPKPPEKPDVVEETGKLAGQIKGLVDKLAMLAEKQRKAPSLNHEELTNMAADIGRIMGKQVNAGWKSPYQYDSLSGDSPWANPSIAIEICDKGVIDKDILSLTWAWQNWKATGILVVVDDKEYQACQRKIPQGARIFPMKARDFASLHSLLQSAGKDAVVSIFGT